MTYHSRDQIWLIGDSITEFSFADNGLAARLGDAYARTFDIINRGFSGYNSRWDALVVKQILPTREQRVKQNLPNIRLFTIWLGANDSVSPGSPQHVPIDEFHKEMTSIIDLMQERSPGTPIILITPGPTQIARWDLPRNHRNRSNAQVEQYVQAIKELGARNDIPVVDAYEATWAAAGSQDEEALQQFYSDGLHLAAPGYEVVWKLVLQTIQSRFPEIDPAQVKRDFPHWGDVDHTNPQASVLRGQY